MLLDTCERNFCVYTYTDKCSAQEFSGLSIATSALVIWIFQIQWLALNVNDMLAMSSRVPMCRRRSNLFPLGIAHVAGPLGC